MPNEDEMLGMDDVPADDQLDARIARLAAAHYHRPPDIAPRDAMWDAIVARRAGVATDGTPHAAPVPVQPLHVTSTRHAANAWGNRSAWWIAAAASLTLATGVGIGRWWSVASNDAVANRDSVGIGAPIAQASRADSTDRAPLVAQSDESTEARAAAQHELATSADDPTVASSRVSPRSATRTTPRPHTARDPDVAYQLATLRHLTEVEALLVSYRDDSADVALDEKLADWSRRLLDETRLLLDSPAAEDPRRRRLLEDLELVLVQMGTLERGAPDRERPLIDETLRHSQLMPRLRAAVPAGTTGI